MSKKLNTKNPPIHKDYSKGAFLTGSIVSGITYFVIGTSPDIEPMTGFLCSFIFSLAAIQLYLNSKRDNYSDTDKYGNTIWNGSAVGGTWMGAVMAQVVYFVLWLIPQIF